MYRRHNREAPARWGLRWGTAGLERLCNTDKGNTPEPRGLPFTISASRNHLPPSSNCSPAFTNSSFSKSDHWCKKHLRLTVKMHNGHVNFYAQFWKSEIQSSKMSWFFSFDFSKSPDLFLFSLEYLQWKTDNGSHSTNHGITTTLSHAWAERSLPLPGVTHQDYGFSEA